MYFLLLNHHKQGLYFILCTLLSQRSRCSLCFNKMSLVSYGDTDSEEEEVELGVTISEQRKTPDIRKLVSVLPAPEKDKKQPVKIRVPSLRHAVLGVRMASYNSAS